MCNMTRFGDNYQKSPRDFVKFVQTKDRLYIGALLQYTCNPPIHCIVFTIPHKKEIPSPEKTAIVRLSFLLSILRGAGTRPLFHLYIMYGIIRSCIQYVEMERRDRRTVPWSLRSIYG